MSDDDEYKQNVAGTVATVREKFPLQPILFVGSGLSQRWVGTPTWDGLLDWAINYCPEIEKPLQFFKQQSKNLPEVAEKLVAPYQNWAWGKGKEFFPESIFEGDFPADIYLKYAVKQHINSFGVDVPKAFENEAQAFKDIRPHAVITTNYDTLLEAVLPDYQPMLGSGLLRSPFASIGEIYKIHGTVDKASSIVLTTGDYEAFSAKRKFLTAKLLTFFAEHPIVIIGYSVDDENIRGILSDLDEALGMPGSVIQNVFFLSRPSGLVPPSEKLLEVSPTKGVRVQAIEATDFAWVFEAFGHNGPISNVNPQVLRSILARSYNLVRSDIPRQKIEVDFDLISEKLISGEEFAKVFGIATLQPATEFSAKYPYNLTEVGSRLGFHSWHAANKIFAQIHDERGVDLKSFDNAYHCTLRISKKSKAQMYSDAAIDLLTKVRDGRGYDLELDDPDKA